MRNHDFFGGGLLREASLLGTVFYTSERPFQEPGSGNDGSPDDCPLFDDFDLTYDIDLEAESIGRPIGATDDLAVRATNPPTPDYVQIFVSRGISVESGNPSELCPPAPEATITWDVSDGPAGAYFPFGVSETIDVSGAEATGSVTHDSDTLALPTGIGGGEIETYLRRPPDASTYVNPGNVGVDTLFPWADFIANPSLHLGLVVSDAHAVSDRTVGPAAGGVLVIVRLWFKVATVLGQVAVVGSA